MRLRLATILPLILAVAVCAPLLLAHADGTFDGQLFGDTNGDRANSCGQPALGWSDSMAAIAQQRAQYIADSGDFTNKLEMSYGAENIGWSAGPTDPQVAADTINQSYMNSTEHRNNVCDGRWDVVGIGSTFRDSWNGKTNVWIDAEEFTVSGGAPPPVSHPSSALGGVSVPGTGGAG